MKTTKSPWKVVFHRGACNVFRLENVMTAEEAVTESEGNRKLIQASPELLENLKVLLIRLAEQNTNFTTWDEYQACMKAVRKATGLR